MNETEEKLKIILHENKSMKEELSKIEGEKMKESTDMDKDTQAPAKGPEGKGATAKPADATQDDMNVKYEEKDMDKDTQAPAKGPEGKGATAKPADATQDDMNVKYEEGEDEDEDNIKESSEEDEDTKKEMSDTDKSDMDKVTEILEAMKSQMDKNSNAIESLKEAATVETDEEEEKPTAPIKESLKIVLESDNKKPMGNLLKQI